MNGGSAGRYLPTSFYLLASVHALLLFNHLFHTVVSYGGNTEALGLVRKGKKGWGEELSIRDGREG
jgi:hypothetical protein